MSELYNTEILRLATSIPFTDRLADADVSVTKTSRICGSRLTLDVGFDPEGRIARIGQTVKACAIGQAACALVAPRLIGASRAEIAPAAQAFQAMLEGRGDPPEGDWRALEIFLPLREHRSRHGSAMLPFRAALAAYDRAAAGETA